MTAVAVVDSDVPGHTCIEQTEDSGLVVRSYAPEAIPVQARLNPDAPPATEARTGYPPQTFAWRMPSAATWQAMGAGTEAQRKAFRAAMVAAGRDVRREL